MLGAYFAYPNFKTKDAIMLIFSLIRAAVLNCVVSACMKRLLSLIIGKTMSSNAALAADCSLSASSFFDFVTAIINFEDERDLKKQHDPYLNE